MAMQNLNWYQLPAREKMELLTILRRIQNPQQLTAGGHFALNMELFASVCSVFQCMRIFTIVRYFMHLCCRLLERITVS